VSRIYDAMKRGAALEASRRSLVAAGPQGAPLVDRVGEGYQRVLHAIQSRQGAKPGGAILIVSAPPGDAQAETREEEGESGSRAEDVGAYQHGTLAPAVDQQATHHAEEGGRNYVREDEKAALRAGAGDV